MIKFYHAVSAMLVVGLLNAPAQAQQEGFRIIVNASNPTATLPEKAVSRLFLKESFEWPDGSAVRGGHGTGASEHF